MRDNKLTVVLTGGLLILGLLVLSSGGTTHADVSQAEVTLEPRAYLPFVAKSYVQPRYPSDPAYPHQWALEKIDGPRAWSLSSGRDIVVAVIDTGVDADHPDLSDKLVDNGWNFLIDAAGADDDHGHGTHVAGIAAATTNNGIGIAGLGWDSRILPVKLLGKDGTGAPDLVGQAIIYATDHGAEVINMSFGIPTECKSDIQEAVTYAHSQGVVVIAAAGNDYPTSPANCEHVIGVAASTMDDEIAGYSSSGAHVSVTAPGSEIYSTVLDGHYGNSSGTSMAAPHVSGLAALLLARYPRYAPDEVASAVLDNAVDLEPSGWDDSSGCGRIDAFQALLNGARETQPLCSQEEISVARVERRHDVDAPFAPGEVIVEFASDASTGSFVPLYAASVEFLPSWGAWRLQVPIGKEREVRDRLRANPEVLQADLNYLAVIQN